MPVKIYFTFFLSLFTYFNVWAQKPFVISSEMEEEILLSPYIEMSLQKEKIHTLSEIQSGKGNFEAYNFEKVPVGSSTIWLRLQLKNTSNVSQSLTLLTSRFDLLTFYFSNGKKVIGGNHYPNTGKEIVYRNNTYAPFVIAENETLDCYIKAVFQDKADLHYEAIPQEFALVKTADLLEEKTSRDFSLWILCGAVAVMFCYNLLLFVLTQERGYMYYAFYTALLFCFNLAFSGKLIEMMSSASLNDQFQNYAGFLALSGMMLFYRKLFNLKDRFPLYEKIIKGLLIYYVLCFPLVYFNFNKIVVATGPLAWLLVFAMGFIPAIQLAKKGNLTAKYFLVGNGVYFFFAVTAMLQTIGQLPPTFLGLKPYSFTISGSIIELILFSLSLGAKMNEMQNNLLNKEKELRHEEEKRRVLVSKQNELLEEKVQERTFELAEANQELTVINEELNSTLETVSVQAETIRDKNKDIMASINYAKRIQKASMPSPSKMKELFTEYFVFHKPRDIVSGDFFWTVSIGHKTLVAVVDCTGHGVPGAFMSMIGSQNLNEITKTKGITSPEKVLTELQRAITENLDQNNTQNQDGMDIALCCIDREAQTLRFAGSKNPLTYIDKKGELHTIKGTSTSIGGKIASSRPFELHEILLQKGMQFYMYSDGFQDQFGGPKGKKFMSRNLRATLYKNYQYTLSEQGQFLKKAFEEWKGHERQIDDVMVVGFRVF